MDNGQCIIISAVFVELHFFAVDRCAILAIPMKLRAIGVREPLASSGAAQLYPWRPIFNNVLQTLTPIFTSCFAC